VLSGLKNYATQAQNCLAFLAQFAIPPVPSGKFTIESPVETLFSPLVAGGNANNVSQAWLGACANGIPLRYAPTPEQINPFISSIADWPPSGVPIIANVGYILCAKSTWKLTGISGLSDNDGSLGQDPDYNAASPHTELYSHALSLAQNPTNASFTDNPVTDAGASGAPGTVTFAAGQAPLYGELGFRPVAE
jgi:hypothetical protein